jgi:hypothetical protein
MGFLIMQGNTPTFCVLANALLMAWAIKTYLVRELKTTHLPLFRVFSPPPPAGGVSLRTDDLLLLQVYVELAFTQLATGLSQGRDKVYTSLGTLCPVIASAIGAIPYDSINFDSRVLLCFLNQGKELLAIVLITSAYLHIDQELI